MEQYRDERERQGRDREREMKGERQRGHTERERGACTYSLSVRQVHMPNWRVPDSMHWRIMRR